jgi:hypothetical protein
MTLFDDFIFKNATLEADLWQIVEDHDLMEQQGWINDCLMRNLARKLQNENLGFSRVDIVSLMDKLYIACLKSLALKSKECSKEAKKLVLNNLKLEQENNELEFTVKMLQSLVDKLIHRCKDESTNLHT